MATITLEDPKKNEEEKPRPPTVNLNFPKDCKVQPEGFELCTPGKKVQVIIEGEVKNVEDSTREYDWGGKNLGLYVQLCRVESPSEEKREEEPAGLSEALEKVKSYVAGK